MRKRGRPPKSITKENGEKEIGDFEGGEEMEIEDGDVMVFDPLVLNNSTIHDEKIIDNDNEDQKNEKKISSVHFEPILNNGDYQNRESPLIVEYHDSVSE